MKTATISYQGALRTEAIHIRSSESIITDAPIDNNGKGEAFSPTDLVATAMVSCMITVMGILAERKGFNMGAVEGEVEKVMSGPPRRISAMNIVLSFTGHNLSSSQKDLLERTAISCPVANSIHTDIAVNVKFKYS